MIQYSAYQTHHFFSLMMQLNDARMKFLLKRKSFLWKP